MKSVFKVAVVGLSFAASSAFAQGVFQRTAQHADRVYVEGAYWQGENAPTSAPWFRGDDIRNANSALWGVGG
jgi:hypothetical protein